MAANIPKTKVSTKSFPSRKSAKKKQRRIQDEIHKDINNMLATNDLKDALQTSKIILSRSK